MLARFLPAIRATLLSLAAVLMPLSVSAALSIEDVWRPPAIASPVMSPDGKFLAVAVPVNGRLNLGVIDLEKRTSTALTNFREFDVIEYHWVGNERLVFSLGARNAPTGPERQDGGGLFAVSRDGKEQRVLSPTVRDTVRSGGLVYRGLVYQRRVPGSSTDIIAAALERSLDTVDLYRVNVVTGRRDLMTRQNPGRVQQWLLDGKGVPRVAVSSEEKSTGFIVRHRDTEDGPWRELWRWDVLQGPATVPLAFRADGKSLIVASNRDRDTMAIYPFDLATNTLGEVIAQHPRLDLGADTLGDNLGTLVIDSNTRELLGLRVQAEREEIVWIDPEAQRLQRSLDAAIPGRLNRFVPGTGDRILVTAYSDRHAARWYLLDRRRMALEEVAASRPWLKPENLTEMRPFTLKTRDGLEIPGYYFLPKDHKPGQRLPTVVHIHGGPWVRADSWGFGTFGSIEGQLLASRGYAVVVPNFRGTPGFGARITQGARRQFGKAMQEDIEDATDWAIRQGFADPGRICLSGASYGGYASLMGIAKTPDRYRCAVAGLAVTDLELIMTSGQGDIPTSELGLAFWKAMAGDPVKDRDLLRSVSPAYLADRMTAPVLLYSGGADIRVPIEQPRRMRAALEARGRAPVWIEQPEEGHGFGLLENNVDLYRKMLDFLDRHIGAGRPKTGGN